MYNVKSPKAEEFIHDGEIRDTLAYAELNKHNAALIDSILEKARLRKGLSHREAAVLLIAIQSIKIRNLCPAEQMKKDIYGNYCLHHFIYQIIVTCVYCPYHYTNKHILRKLIKKI